MDPFQTAASSPTEDRFIKEGFHRKRIGLNHIAFYAPSKVAVDDFYKNVLLANGIPSLYQQGPDGNNEYYSVLFEDPDRMKIEVVFAPNYCDRQHWPNTVESDFDPSLSE